MNENEGAPATAGDIPTTATPRQRTVAGKKQGVIVRNVGIPKTTAAKKTRGKRTGTRTVGTKRAYTRRATAATGTASFAERAAFYSGLADAKNVTLSFTKRGGSFSIVVPVSELLQK